MSDDPMRGLFGEAPEPFGFDYGLGGVAAYLPGQESAFNRGILTGIIDSTIQQGLQGLPTAADALAGDTPNAEAEYLLENISVEDGIQQNEINAVVELIKRGLVTAEDVSARTGIPAAEIQQTYNTLTGLPPETEQNINEELADLFESEKTEDFSTGLENEMLDPNILGEGDESIVTDDPEAQWEEVDKDADFDVILGEALDIFGAYNRDAISKVVDVVNDRGMSVGEVATATGNTVESINQAAAESGTAIENQSLVPPEPPTPDPEPPTPDPEPPTPEPPADPDPEPPADPAIVIDTPVTPEPTLTAFMPELPQQQTTNITLLQNIMNETPITESILFPTKFTKLENVQQGMFERFLSAAGGNQ